MLWWIVGGFLALVGLRLVFEWRHGLLPRAPGSPEPIDDPRLGRLTYSADAKGWEGRLQLGSAEIELSMSGPPSGPDPAVVEAARQLADRGPELVESLQKLVAAQAPAQEEAQDPVLAAHRAEMLSLVVESIHIYSPGPPLSCMLFFKEDPAHTGIWRCSYDGQRVFDFGVDT